MRVDRLRVEIDPPHHGWTRVRLTQRDATYEFFPSHVPYDSIGDLVGALLAVARHRHDGSVRWNDEPVEHVLSFSCGDASITMLLSLVEPTRSGESLTPVFSVEGTVRDTVRPFWKALRDMQGKQSLLDYERQWHGPFPDGTMRQLSEELRAGSVS